MEFTFLGTSSGAPTKSRNVTSLALATGASKNWYMVDCGEATQHQLLHTPHTAHTLKAIFITHIHGDHCYGLPGLLGGAALAGRKSPLTIVCPANVAAMVKAVQQYTRLWLEFELEFIILESLTEALQFDDYLVEPIVLSHRVPCWGFNFIERRISAALNIEKLKADRIEPGPVWGQIQKGIDVNLPDGRVITARDYLLAPRKPRVILVAGDNDTPALLQNVRVKPDVVIHESTYTEDIAEKVGKAPQHSCAKIVAEYAEQAAINNLILTHFSARYTYSRQRSPSIHDIEAEARRFYQGNLFLANDFDTFELDTQGIVKYKGSAKV